MTIAAYAEDSLVRQAAAKSLEQRVGWESVYDRICEGLGSDNLPGCSLSHALFLSHRVDRKVTA